MVSDPHGSPEYKVAADAQRSAAAGKLPSDRIDSLSIRCRHPTWPLASKSQPVARSSIVVKLADASCSAALRPFG
jgi:hypothetical protein